MADSLLHRGPDDSGTWFDDQTHIVMSHRRLSIVDLSEQGHQPMMSESRRYVIVFNGEIYNHKELRQLFGSHRWRGHSDTETLLACIERFGVQGALAKLVGMFAFAVWDCRARSLTLARDRMGEKPLYYGKLPSGEWVFASELKALRVHPRWHGEIDRGALALYLRHNCVPAPWSIYKGIKKLQPGCWIALREGGEAQSGSYWSVIDVARQKTEARASALQDEVAIDQLESLLTQSIASQMLADVPLGAFLSGGVDSSTIVALMQKQSSARIRTFSIGFNEPGYDEAQHARAVAEHLGTNHSEVYVSAADALRVVPQLPSIYDEPFGDSSQIPTFLVAKLAREQVAVALSGDGGDELFAGYSRYMIAQRMWRHLQRLPMRLRRQIAAGVLAIPPGAWDALAQGPMALLPLRMRQRRAGDQLHKFATAVLPAANAMEMYRALISHWQDPAAVVLDTVEPTTILQDEAAVGFLDEPVNRMSLSDQLTYLPDDILVKVDRAAMAVSLETRVPLLDHRVVEFAWQLPMHQKIRAGQSKWLLRQVLYRRVPRELIERPKQGFAVPLDHWLRGPLREWGESLLAPKRLSQDGFFHVEQVQSKWREHQSGVRNWQYQLWDILMFQAWHEQISASIGTVRDAA